MILGRRGFTFKKDLKFGLFNALSVSYRGVYIIYISGFMYYYVCLHGKSSWQSFSYVVYY